MTTVLFYKNNKITKNAAIIPIKPKYKPKKHLAKPLLKPAASIEEVVATIMKLAEMPLHDLQNLMEGEQSSTNSNPFQIQKLQDGQCPWKDTSTTLSWLPQRLSSQPYSWYKQEVGKTSQSKIDSSSSNNPVVAVYYEHLSKAGGTSFCKLAQSNLDSQFVPRYYCMPSKKDMLDARVGSWTKQDLKDYFLEKSHRLVSNEWEPFNLEFLDFQYPIPNSSTINDDKSKQVFLIFLTSIRNPINRLMSAYKFWGILHNQAENKPTFETWLGRYAKRAQRFKVLSGDFVANVGRFNFATWKFSGGSLEVSKANFEAERILKADDSVKEPIILEKDWKEPFQTAIRTLARFDLVIPMEELSTNTQPLADILGWKDYSKNHVVPSGKVVNNAASSELSPQVYNVLWQANHLDMIIYYWSLAVYLTRLHCSESLQ